MNKIYDVIVVGAGPGGSAAAYYLHKAGLQVLLLDKAEFPRDKTCGDGLTPRALQVLSDMGILEQVNQIGFRITGIELHGRSGDSFKADIPKHDKYPDHITIAPRLKLDNLILERVVQKNIEYLSPVRVTGIVDQGNEVEIQATYKGKKLIYTSRLVVMAVGANMKLLQQLDILKYQPEPILAARGYYEDVEGLTDRIEAHFEDVPLPGYGWVFPISKTAANIGIGYWKSRLPWINSPSSGRAAMEHWLSNSPKLASIMANAKPLGPIKGYPLRVDFPTAPTCKGRIFLVGEAAGLVSPLTGEGIDFALESAKFSADYISQMFLNGDFSEITLAGYDAMLRQQYQHLFIFLERIRQIYVNPTLMKRYIQACKKFPELKDLLMKVLLSQSDAKEMVTFSVIRKVVLGI